jgi:cation:H+ antiporter
MADILLESPTESREAWSARHPFAGGADVVIAAFCAGAVISLATSWVLVTRMERIGERLGFSEALLGVLAALAADTPEITSAVTALVHHEGSVGSGVVIGSNVFNLAALLGLGAVVAGRIVLHRKVVVLGGAVAAWVAIVCVVTVVGLVPAAAGLVLVLVVVVPSIALVTVDRASIARLRFPSRWTAWLSSAVAEEEDELLVAIRPRRGTRGDAVVAALALVVIVASSVVMERAASSVGRNHRIAGIVVGGLVLAAVTSLPNAVAGVYLAARGRGAAMLSTTLASNTFNVVLGLLLPATVVGLARPTGGETLIVTWYGALTVVTLVFAYGGRGLRRGQGWVIIAGYVGFVVALLAVA